VAGLLARLDPGVDCGAIGAAAVALDLVPAAHERALSRVAAAAKATGALPVGELLADLLAELGEATVLELAGAAADTVSRLGGAQGR